MKHNSLIHTLYDKKGKTLSHIKVGDYILCSNLYIEKIILKGSIEELEAGIFKVDRKKIIRKLCDCIKMHRSNNEMKILEAFFMKYQDHIKNHSMKSISSLFESISRLEKLDISGSSIYNYVSFSGKIQDTDSYDLNIIKDSRFAWEDVLENIHKVITLDEIIRLNSLVTRNQALKVGGLRDGEVTVSGSNYIPEIPTVKRVSKFVEKIAANRDRIDAAVEYFCIASKQQFFYDGNKRTSLIVANKILVQSNLGIMYFSKSNFDDFSIKLSRYYNAGITDKEEKDELKLYITTNCISNFI